MSPKTRSCPAAWPPRWSVFVVLLIVSSAALGQDWPRWGGDASCNMVAPLVRGLPADFDPGSRVGLGDRIDQKKAKAIKWIAKLGSNTYGNPTVAAGRVYVGTNNDAPRQDKFTGDRSNVYCLDEQTGEFLWQLSVPKLGAGKVGDWEYLGICSSPTVDGDRIFLVTNRCEVVCLDAAGMANGNDGPFTDEDQYAAGPGKPPIAIGEEDADILWRFDIAGEVGAFPHNVTSSSVLVIGDRVYANTSNGVDYSHKHIINQRAPALIVLDKATGQLIGEEAAGISQHVFHGSWSSPSSGLVGKSRQIFFGAGDGFCYGFDAEPMPGDDGFSLLGQRWRFDCNPARYRIRDGQPNRYATYKGPSEIIATPVFHDNKVYVAIGQDPEHGEGVGALSCIDATQQGDVSAGGRIWQYTDIDRTIGTVSIDGGLLYVADYAGVIHCLDTATGAVYWKHDTQGHIWGSTLVADGKVFAGNEDGYLTILEAGRQKKLLAVVDFGAPIYSSPVAANGTLYVATMMHLYAIQK